MVTVTELYDLARRDWGGATIDRSNGELVPHGTNAYAVSVTGGKLHVDDTAGIMEFTKMLSRALRMYDAPYLGIFHDMRKHVIEFDAVFLVQTKRAVDLLADQFPAVRHGGAYHFGTGDDYFPGRCAGCKVEQGVFMPNSDMVQIYGFTRSNRLCQACYETYLEDV